jgi:hypothetical protein
VFSAWAPMAIAALSHPPKSRYSVTTRTNLGFWRYFWRYGEGGDRRYNLPAPTACGCVLNNLKKGGVDIATTFASRPGETFLRKDAH